VLGNFAGVRSFVAILNLSFIRQTTRINSDMAESSNEMHVRAILSKGALSTACRNSILVFLQGEIEGRTLAGSILKDIKGEALKGRSLNICGKLPLALSASP